MRRKAGNEFEKANAENKWLEKSQYIFNRLLESKIPWKTKTS